MDFNNIFNRVRKIKTNNHSTVTLDHNNNNNNSKSGLKKIATSRKVMTNQKRAVCQVHSTESTNSTGSSICNSECSQTIKTNISPPTTGVTKPPVTIQYSNADSGIESSTKKQNVTQQDSNTSTGSVLSGHVNMASELERRCQAAAKLAFKEETKEYKEKKKIIPTPPPPQPEQPVTIRRAAIDLDSLAKMNGNTKKKKSGRKKHRLKSDQSHARINVDKIMKRTSSSSDVRQVNDQSDDNKDNFEYENSDEDGECNSSDYTDFADDETRTESGTGSDSAGSHHTGSSEFDSGNGATNSSEGTHSEGEVKRTIVEVDTPKLIDKAKLNGPKKKGTDNNVTVATKNDNSIHNINNKYKNTELPTASIPSPAMQNKIQTTSRRVNGVTLRDLYSLRAVLSDSDNGTVFSGRRRIDNAAVAIKRIMKCKVKRWHLIKDKSVPMEIALLRKVNEQRHPGVVTLLEWFECSDCFLLVMARPTPVLDLFDFVSEKKRLDEQTARVILVQVLQSMIHCHAKLVLHRDIKLENVLVKTDTLTVTIIDFGCGTAFDENLYKDFAGTPQYYPPEYYICKQYHGLPAAVWSVGVMLYAMLCGRLPFASAHEIVHLEPSWHGSFCRKISPAAKDLVEGMLKKQPRRRTHMSDILKHRWLKSFKYNPLSGDVTIITDDEINNSSNCNGTISTSRSSNV